MGGRGMRAGAACGGRANHLKGRAMQITDPARQTDALAVEVSTGRDVSRAALQAVQRVRDLECAVRKLRKELDGMSAEAARQPARREEIVRLLSEVALFRLALADKTGCLDNK